MSVEVEDSSVDRVKSVLSFLYITLPKPLTELSPIT